MRKFRSVAAIAIALLVMSLTLTGCGGEEEPEPTAEVTRESMEVEAGEEFQVVLETNPSTGYDWIIEGELDTSVIELIGEEIVQPEEDEPVLGAPVDQVWKFRGAAPGTADVTFEYIRPWEEDEPPASTHVVTVTVTASRRAPDDDAGE